MRTVTLYRPVGHKDLDLIAARGYRAFPPRLPEQPIFYPVLNREYAEQIARDWNTKNAPYVGYVTEFEVNAEYISGYTVQKVGGAAHLEYWIPAEELEKFNQNICGEIKVIATFRGMSPARSLKPMKDIVIKAAKEPIE